MPITRNQHRTIEALRGLTDAGQPVCRETLSLAHRIRYSQLANADASKVAAVRRIEPEESKVHGRSRL